MEITKDRRRDFYAGFLSGVLVSAILFLCLLPTARREVYQEAVDNGVAKWVISSDRNIEFTWITNK